MKDFYAVNIIRPDDLATQAARPSAAMILTQLNRDSSATHVKSQNL